MGFTYSLDRFEDGHVVSGDRWSRSEGDDAP